MKTTAHACSLSCTTDNRNDATISSVSKCLSETFGNYCLIQLRPPHSSLTDKIMQLKTHARSLLKQREDLKHHQKYLIYTAPEHTPRFATLQQAGYSLHKAEVTWSQTLLTFPTTA